MKTPQDEFIRFRFLTEVRMGRGLSKKVPEFLNECSEGKIVVVADEIALAEGVGKQMLELLTSSRACRIIPGPKGEPDFEYLEETRKKALDFGPSMIVGIGGGATIDAGKGLAVVYCNERPCSDYQGFDLLEKPGLPYISIPTLFGAGTEVTPSAVFINRKKGVKGGINGRFVFPRMAIIDPELGLSAPKYLIGATGLDALVHCIEGFVAQCSTCLSRMYSKEGFNRVLPALNVLSKDSRNAEAMEQLAFGALLAISGLMHSESGICGAISYPLGVRFHVPHGLAGGLFMPKAIRMNEARKEGIYDELLDTPSRNLPGEKTGEKIALWIEKMIQDFALPSLSSFAIQEDDVPLLAQEIHGFKPVLSQNPVEISKEMIQKLFLDVLHA